MSAQRGQVVWSANAQPSFAERHGLTDVAYTSAGQPELDQEEEETVVSRYEQVALLLGEAQDQGIGSLCITTR